MEALTLVVPAIASAALGGALLLPIRDGRAGRRATYGGRSPLLVDFRHRIPQDDVESNMVSEPSAEQDAQEGRTANEDPIEARASRRNDDENAIPIGIADASRRSRKDLASIIIRRFVGGFGAFVDRLRSLRPRYASIDADSAPVSSDLDVISERSFAAELATLLPVRSSDEQFCSGLGKDDDTSGPFEPSRARASETTVEARLLFDDCLRRPHETHEIPVVVRHDSDSKPSPDRAVPLTRLPLRHVSTKIVWPASAIPPLQFLSDGDRYAFLRGCSATSAPIDEALLGRAFREETELGRALTLAALRRSHPARETIDIFIDALVTGSDEERATAIDALSEAGHREEVTRGLSDRVDAIAAQAALAYVGTTVREDYCVALAPFLEQARIETLLALLAGIVE